MKVESFKTAAKAAVNDAQGLTDRDMSNLRSMFQMLTGADKEEALGFLLVQNMPRTYEAMKGAASNEQSFSFDSFRDGVRAAANDAEQITDRDTVLNRLNAQIAELTELLALERAGNRDLQDNISLLQSSLTEAEAARAELQGLIDSSSAAAGAAGDQIGVLSSQLADEKRVSQRALAQVELLNQQIAALRRQIAALEDALDASESRDRESSAKIADLG